MIHIERDQVYDGLLPRATESDIPESPQVPKSTVIAITVTATILVVAFISGGILFFIRRRTRNVKAKGHGRAHTMDRNIDSPLDPAGKRPLIQQDDLSSFTEHRSQPVPKDDEENDIDITSQPLRRSFSGVSLRSLPPAYSAAMQGTTQDSGSTVNRTSSLYSHRHGSSAGGSDGLRPLMLLQGRESPDSDPGDVNGRGREQRLVRPDSSLAPGKPAGRPRASSRFREEDLDM